MVAADAAHLCVSRSLRATAPRGVSPSAGVRSSASRRIGPRFGLTTVLTEYGGRLRRLGGCVLLAVFLLYFTLLTFPYTFHSHALFLFTHAFPIMLTMVTCTIAIALATDCTTWYEQASHGEAYRSVATFGAVGDSVTDDTKSIQAAIDYAVGDDLQKRPAVVYFPPGRYLLSDTLQIYWHTHLLGNQCAAPSHDDA